MKAAHGNPVSLDDPLACLPRALLVYAPLDRLDVRGQRSPLVCDGSEAVGPPGSEAALVLDPDFLLRPRGIPVEHALAVRLVLCAVESNLSVVMHRERVFFLFFFLSLVVVC